MIGTEEKQYSEIVEEQVTECRWQMEEVHTQTPLSTAVFIWDPKDADEKEVLRQYLDLHPELEVFHYYTSDSPGVRDSVGMPDESVASYSGMQQDVRSGKIQCIVEMSLDRFAGGYVETAYYILNYLQYMNVRFIAVQDEFDSARDEDMVRIAEKAGKLAADVRSKRQSKMRCDLARRRASEPDAMPNGTAPYGYLVAPDAEKKCYIPDPATASNVRMMFKWAVFGLSSGQIAERMALLGMPTPGQLRTGKSADPSKWDAHTVLKILQNPNYMGNIYLGRMQQALYKEQPWQRRTSSDEWTIRENTHEPLVTREDFEKTQKLIKDNCKKKPEGESRNWQLY